MWEIAHAQVERVFQHRRVDKQQETRSLDQVHLQMLDFVVDATVAYQFVVPPPHFVQVRVDREFARHLDVLVLLLLVKQHQHFALLRQLFLLHLALNLGLKVLVRRFFRFSSASAMLVVATSVTTARIRSARLSHTVLIDGS